jgi:hypothetical protein
MLARRLSVLGVTAALALLLALPAHAGTAYVIEATNSSGLPSNIGTMVTTAGGVLSRTHPEIGVAQATSTDPNFATKLAAMGGIQGVAPDMTVQWTPPASAAIQSVVALSHPPVPALNPQGAFFYACQWALPQINAPAAWAQGAFGSPAVKVAVLDTGVDANHIDLAGKIDLAESTSVITPGTSPCGSADETTITDFDFHGTFVSSLITGNLLGMAAVAPNTNVVMVKVLNCAGEGSFGDIIAGLHYAAGLSDVGILNMSLGALIPKQGNATLIDAIGRAVLFATLRGKLVVVAAGNDGEALGPQNPNIEVPAQSPGATAIYATTINRQLTSYTDFGFPATWVGAPGGDLPNPAAALPGCPVAAADQSLIFGACAFAACGGENFYVLGAGTSFASPMVAAVSDLVEGVHPQCRTTPGLTKLVLAATADQIGPIQSFAFGEVDAGRAVKFENFLNILLP